MKYSNVTNISIRENVSLESHVVFKLDLELDVLFVQFLRYLDTRQCF